MQSVFAMLDLGSLHYYLGIEFMQHADGGIVGVVVTNARSHANTHKNKDT